MFTETLRPRKSNTSLYRKALFIYFGFAAVFFFVVILLLWSLWSDIDDLNNKECAECFFDENFASCKNVNLLYVPACLPPNLVDLRMYGNFLRKLVWAHPRQFPKLQYLDVGLNGLAKLPEDSFLHMPDLTHLFLDLNVLVSLPDGVFRNNTEMMYLSLEQNNLRWLNLAMFEPLTLLQYLKLSGNKIARLDGVRGFYNNRQLILLDLSSNRLRSLGNLYLIPETESTVYLERNPWVCDVGALRFVLSSSDLGVVIGDRPLCSGPPQVLDVPLIDLNCSLSILSASSDNDTSTKKIALGTSSKEEAFIDLIPTQS